MTIQTKGIFIKCLVLVLAVLSIQSANLYNRMDCISAGILSFDFDGYWHLLRVQEIHHTGSWDNAVNSRGNAPYGENIHWTHAMDIVLWAGATVGSLFMDFDSSLYWWGVFVGPVFYMLSLAVLILFGRVFLGAKHLGILVLLFLVNLQQACVVYSINRPDHHCLVAFAFVLYYCSFILLLEKPESTRLALLTGILGALGLWCGLELLMLVGLSALYLGFLWLVKGEMYLKANRVLAFSLAMALMVTLLADEKPANYWVAAYDKRSIIHVMLFLFIALYWLIALLLTRSGFGRKTGPRLMVAALGGISIVAVFLVLFPDFLHGPMEKVDPALYTLYLHKTSEFGQMNSLDLIVYCALLALPGLIYVVWAGLKGRKRAVFFWLALTLCTYSVMSLSMERWTYTLSFLTVLPGTLLFVALKAWRGSEKHPIVVFTVVITLVCTPYVALLLLPASERKTVDGDYLSKLVRVLSFLESQDYTLPRDTILANIYVGPAIMWHSSFDAVGTPNHSNDKGIIDTYRILNTADDAAAMDLIAARGIDYLLIDEPLKQFSVIRLDPGGQPESTRIGEPLITRLSNGHVPDWLIEKPLPEGLRDTFSLYQVTDSEAGAREHDQQPAHGEGMSRIRTNTVMEVYHESVNFCRRL